MKMNDVIILAFDQFLVWLKEYLCSANMEDQDQADQEDETKRTGVVIRLSESFWCTN